MEKAEARKKLKGLQLIVHNRGDEELESVFDEVAAYIEKERPKRAEKKSRDRMDRGGINRGAKS